MTKLLEVTYKGKEQGEVAEDFRIAVSRLLLLLKDQRELHKLVSACVAKGDLTLCKFEGDRGVRIQLEAPTKKQAEKLRNYSFMFWSTAKLVWKDLEVVAISDTVYNPSPDGHLSDAIVYVVDDGYYGIFKISNRPTWTYCKHILSGELNPKSIRYLLNKAEAVYGGLRYTAVR
jgi:hypothetical protein